MKQMINTTDYAFDVERYRDEADAISFAGNLGMDGFELLPCEGGRDDFFTERSVVGDILIPGWISGMENWRC